MSAEILLTELNGTSERNWMVAAKCKDDGIDPALFFPGRGGSNKEAKEICDECPVREDCLEFALANNENRGVWGGKSEIERRNIKRRRRALARSAMQGTAKEEVPLARPLSETPEPLPEKVGNRTQANTILPPEQSNLLGLTDKIEPISDLYNN